MHEFGNWLDCNSNCTTQHLLKVTEFVKSLQKWWDDIIYFFIQYKGHITLKKIIVAVYFKKRANIKARRSSYVHVLGFKKSWFRDTCLIIRCPKVQFRGSKVLPLLLTLRKVSLIKSHSMGVFKTMKCFQSSSGLKKKKSALLHRFPFYY